ncbi:MAG: flagellar hook assembly protein FlgD [Pseudomonadota bacterium]|jgi:flagellar basal-body rod modification protein FlgD
MAITPINNAPASGASAGTASSVKTTKDDFMKLLVTQMKYQDPMNPMDNAQMTSQIAQLNTVEGINQLNATVSGLQASLMATQSMQSASLIGKSILADGNSINLLNGSASLSVRLEGPAESVVVDVINSSGRIIKTADLGANAAGIKSFTWDGSTNEGGVAPNGQYTFQVNAKKLNQAVVVTPLTQATVSGVELTSAGPQLSLNNGTNIAMSTVRGVR